MEVVFPLKKDCISMCDHGSKVLCPRREEVLVVMQILQSVESPISHKLDCLEKCDHQNFFKVQEEE